MARARALTVWKDRYNSSRIYKETETQKRWKRAEDFYDNKHWEGITTTYEDHITINLTKTLCDTIRDSIYFQNPQAFFEAVDAENDITADVLNDIFPQVLKKIMYKQMTKLVVLDALKYGVGYKYNGYSLKGDKSNDAIKPDELFSIWIPHDSVTFEKDAHGAWDANYMFMEVTAGYEDVKNHPAYKVPKNFEPSFIRSDVKYRDSEDPKGVKLIHVFDRGEGKHRIFTQENQTWIYNAEWPLGDLNYFPINTLRLNENGLYPPGVIDIVMDLNEELNKMESMKVTHAKRWNRKYHIKGEALGTGSQKALDSGIDGAQVPTGPDTEIVPIIDADLNPAVYATIQTYWEWMKLLIRIGEYRMGAKPKGEVTATEATFIEGGTSLGIEYQRDVVGDFCERDFVCLLKLMQLNYDTPRQFRLSKERFPDDYKVRFELTKKELEDIEFNLKIDVEGSAPPEHIQMKNEAMALQEIFGNDPFINPLKPREHLLKTFRSVNNEREWLNSNATLQLIAQAVQGGSSQLMNREAIKGYLESGQSADIIQPGSRWSI